MSWPCPLPMSAADAERFLRGDPELSHVRGSFLCFVMIAVEERIGAWRFAGTARSQAEVLAALESFHRALFGEDVDLAFADWMSTMDMDLKASWSYGSLPHEVIGEHEVVLFAEGGAPYDAGLAILAVASFGAFAEKSPEIERPSTWPDP